MIRAVIFDVGFTLVRAEPSEEALVLAALQGAGLEISPPQLAEAAGKVFAEERALGKRDLNLWANDRNIKRYWLDFYRRLLAALRVPPALHAEVAERIYLQFVEHGSWSPYPEVEDVLTELRARGYILGAVSDWQTILLELVHHLDLARFLEFVVVSAVIGLAKPEPRLFHHAVERAGVAPHEALFVGDTYATDVMGARAAGLHPVLIARGEAPDVMDVPVIRSLSELLDFPALQKTAPG